MNAATVSAIAGAPGVAAGALISSVGVVLRERLVSRRERETQQELRRQTLAMTLVRLFVRPLAVLYASSSGGASS
jgi:hypothetical protein